MSREENLKYYELLRKVPDTAKKPISGGRLNGMTDINPMWRIKAMTEIFGLCGVGWKYEINKQWYEQFGNEVKAFTNINLYIRECDEWSAPIPGTGGATLVEAKGYVSDEGFKMSLTDALSVAMKSLGVGADVYFAKDVQAFDTKYGIANSVAPSQPANVAKPKPAPSQPAKPVTIETVKGWIAKAKTEGELLKCYNACPDALKAEAKPLLSARKQGILNTPAS